MARPQAQDASCGSTSVSPSEHLSTSDTSGAMAEDTRSSRGLFLACRGACAGVEGTTRTLILDLEAHRTSRLQSYPDISRRVTPISEEARGRRLFRAGVIEQRERGETAKRLRGQQAKSVEAQLLLSSLDWPRRLSAGHPPSLLSTPRVQQ